MSGLGPDENHVKLLLQKLALLNSYGTELFEGQVWLCTTVVHENTLKTSRSEEGYPCDLKGSKKLICTVYVSTFRSDSIAS